VELEVLELEVTEPAVTKVNRGLGLLRDTGNGDSIGKRFRAVAGGGHCPSSHVQIVTSGGSVTCVDGCQAGVAVGVEVVK